MNVFGQKTGQIDIKLETIMNRQNANGEQIDSDPSLSWLMIEFYWDGVLCKVRTPLKEIQKSH